MRVLLLNPPSAFNRKFVSRDQGAIGVVDERFLPSEIFLTAAYLRGRGHEVYVVDLDGELDFSPYQVVVVWVCVLHSYHRDVDWLRRAKDAGCRTVMILNDAYQGFEAGTMQGHPFIDAAVRLWERQLSLGVLLDSWRGDARPEYPGLIVRNGDTLLDAGEHPRCTDLSHLISCAPLLRQWPLDSYQAVGITSGRGCTARHRFCRYSGTAQGKRELEYVVAEIEAVADRLPWILFLDPDLYAGREWAQELCHEMIRRKLIVRWRADVRPEQANPEMMHLYRAAGCTEAMMAIQTLDPGVARELGAGQSPELVRGAIKALRSAGIRPLLYFYVGWPWDSAQSLRGIEHFLREEAVASFYLMQVRPWPGTRIAADFRDLGLLDRELQLEDFVESGSPLCPSLFLSREGLEEWKHRIGRAGILQPRYLWRFLRERRLQRKHIGQFFSLLRGRNIFAGQ
jgi:radical SAM superfamily enzyme YgiQ (UPF0313 family)